MARSVQNSMIPNGPWCYGPVPCVQPLIALTDYATG
jgi:hypothetical protein